ncbi:MAG TPA: thioredoxin-dependent thiol peroxidase [Chitinophagaceae bacterium]|nr:thioredoxin-dependent thiol peroxidase [Chitinophagaceae bacterium]
MILKPGDKAPAFTAKDQDGNTVSLKDFKGRKVVLYFYPKDDTPTCTVQACNLRDNFAQLKAKDITVIGISVDDEKKHKKFETKYNLPFTLLADPERKIVEAYGVWGEKQFMGRTIIGTHRVSFLVDEKGKIAHIIDKVKSKIHTDQILEFWG